MGTLGRLTWETFALLALSACGQIQPCGQLPLIQLPNMAGQPNRPSVYIEAKHSYDLNERQGQPIEGTSQLLAFRKLLEKATRESTLFNEMASSYLQLAQAQKVRQQPYAINSQGTLYGENAGDFIILQWDLNDDAMEYFVYRSTSLNGPWKQVLRTSQGAATTGGAKVDFTPDARLKDLCYKVEAIDATGVVIEFYEPICVPKFVRLNELRMQKGDIP